MKIIPMQAHHLKLASVLFNEYRMFYGKPSDLEGAELFLQQRLLKNESHVFLAMNEEETQAIGFVQIYSSFTSVGLGIIYLLNDLYVHPHYRKQGVAQALLDKVRLAACEAGAKKIILQTALSNTNAQKLYESCGYSKEELFLTYS